MTNRLLTNLLALSALLTTAGCPHPKEPQPKTIRAFQARGIVKEISQTRTQLRIAHEPIPNPAQPNPAPAFRPAREVQPLQIGDALPNYPFVNQENQPVQLREFKGRFLIFTFIFTRCPLPKFCPRMSQHFKTACESLQNDPQAPDNFHFLTISFDPAFDTSKILKNYAQTLAANPEKWSFLTGKIADIDALAEQCGLYFTRAQQLIDSWDHNLRTVLVDPQGTIRQIYIGNLWTPETLIADIKAAAQNTKNKPPKTTSIP